MKKLLMLTTGGTIASTPTAEGFAPSGSGEILSHLGLAPMDFTLETKELLTPDSSNSQPDESTVVA